jgi:hypothetical protein
MVRNYSNPRSTGGYGYEIAEMFGKMFAMYGKIAIGVGAVSGGTLFVNIGDKVKVEYYGKKVKPYSMGALVIGSVFGFACGIVFPISIPINCVVIVYNLVLR